MPNLKVVFSVGAGVDHLATAGVLPEVPVVRFVDPSLTNRMSEWVCLQCLLHLRTQRLYDERQRARKWEQSTHCQAADLRVGVMGLGVLGLDAAQKLSGLGFQVCGWSRTKKQVDGMATFDESGLDAFLSQCGMLVGLLPLTAETEGFYNRTLFEKLPRETPIGGPVFINAGRGRSQVEADIVACLEDGTLGGVSLDVFETEPLPETSPLWGFENAYLTPHTAAESDATSLARYVAGQIDRYERGEPLENVVNRDRGY